MTPVNIAPHVRAGFVLLGTTLRAWCVANDIDPGYAHKVLAGKTRGPKALMLRARLFEASQGKGA